MDFKELLNSKTKTRGPSDVVAMDFATSGIKVVRLRMIKDELHLVNAAVLPQVQLDNATDEEASEDEKVQFDLPRELRAKHVALTTSSNEAVVRFISLAGGTENRAELDNQVRQRLGLLEGMEYRVSSLLTKAARGKSEAELLAVALPETQASHMLNLFSTGIPAPVSLEISGLTTLNAFMRVIEGRHRDESVCMVDIGARTTFFAILSNGTLVLAKSFTFGGDTLNAKLQKEMGLEQEEAHGIITDGSFDISQTIKEVMGPFFDQFNLSKDYVERREGMPISAVYVSGGMSLSPFVRESVADATGIQVKTWNPFEAVKVAPDILQDDLEEAQTRFAAAIGVGLNAFSTS